MNILLTLLIVLSLLVVSIAWIPPKRLPAAQVKSTEKKQSTILKVAQPTEKLDKAEKTEFLSEFLLSSKPDQSSIRNILGSQALLVAVVLGVSLFTHQNYGLDFMKFDFDSMRTAAFIAAPMVVGGFVFDNLSWNVAKEIKRDTQAFTLRLFGRESSVINVVLLAFLIAGSLIQIHIMFCELTQRNLSTY